MSGELVAAVTIASFLAYVAVAVTTRRRSIRARGPSVRRAGGLASALPYFVPVPYLVIALRPGPEIAVAEPLRWLGLAIVVAGVAFAGWAALTLGRHFDMDVELHAGHEVVRRGPYAIVRHPVYSGLLLHFAGACFATGNLGLIAGTLLVSAPAFYLRARREEALLRSELGAAYDEYAREVPMLVPYVRGNRT